AGGSGAAGGSGGSGGGIPLGPYDANAVYSVGRLRGAAADAIVTCVADTQASPQATPGLDSATRVRIHPTNQNLYYLKAGSIRVATPDPVLDNGGALTYPDAAAAEQNDLDTNLACSSGGLVDFVFDPLSGGAYLACDTGSAIEWYTPTGARFTTCDRD